MALQGPVSRVPFALRRTVSRMARTGAGTLCSMWMAVVVVILPLIAPDLFPSSSWQTAIFSVRMGFPSSKLPHLDSVCTIIKKASEMFRVMMRIYNFHAGMGTSYIQARGPFGLP